MKQRILLIAFILSFALLGLIISNADASSGISAYYVESGGTHATSLDGKIYMIVNSTADTIYIPARTLTEQQSFLNNLPSGVAASVSPCGGETSEILNEESYPITEIGSQCWMAKNLNYTTGSSYCYDNNTANCTIYGRLYDFTTATSACPSGWHLPSDNEWKILEEYLGTAGCRISTAWLCSPAGDKLKEVGTTHWTGNLGSTTNSSGFTAIGSGYRYDNGGSWGLSSIAWFWSSSFPSSFSAVIRTLTPDQSAISSGYRPQTYAGAVRCLKN